MSQLSYHLHVQRIDATRNMARFCRLALEPTLFGDVSVVRNWGRIGTRGQEKIHVFESEKQTLALFLDLLRQKRQKGYRPVSCAVKAQNCDLVLPGHLRRKKSAKVDENASMSRTKPLGIAKE